MNNLFVSAAYKYVAIYMMLTEASYCCNRLHLKDEVPIRHDQIRRAYVAPPRLVPILGSIDTEHYSYSFGEGGKLCFITRLDAFEPIPMNELQKELSKVPGNMSTNQAYELATNWLSAISVDVAALERACPSIVQQHFFLDGAVVRTPLPIFDVIWGTSEHPAVIVTIYAPKRELLRMREENLSFSRRPGLHIDSEALLNISDGDFFHYTPEQKSNLVSHFVVVSGKHTNHFNSVPPVTNSVMLTHDK